MTTPYNQLRQLLTDRHKHLKELSFGCEVQFSFSYATIIGKQENGDYILVKKEVVGEGNETIVQSPNMLNRLVEKYGILGHPPTLSDILLAIDIKNNGLDTGYRTLGGGLDFKADMGLTYDLTKPLADQTDEVLLDLIKILE